jgi:hypothetical protein
MANVSRIVGADYVGSLLGHAVNAKITPCLYIATDGTASFIGDFVKSTGEDAVYSTTGLRYPVVTQAAATETLRGFIVGFAPDPTDLSNLYRKATTLRLAYVCDDPYALFIMQRDGTSAATDVGKNTDIVVGAGNTITGMSGMYLNGTVGTGSAQIRIIQTVPGVDNAMATTYTKYICMINEHEFKSTSGV